MCAIAPYLFGLRLFFRPASLHLLGVASGYNLVDKPRKSKKLPATRAERIIEMGSKFKQFIASLQRADDTTKQRWVIGASAVSMLLVILLWLVYLTFTLPELESITPQDGTSTSTIASVEAPPEPTLLNTFSRGFSVLLRQTEAGLAGFASRIAENVATIKKGIEKKNVIEVQGTPSPQLAPAPAATSTDSNTTTTTP